MKRERGGKFTAGGVYISYPFCGQKCTYCNFASGVHPAALEQEYLRPLMAEIRGHVWEWMPDTVYLGGGSPGRLGLPALEAILQAVPGRPWREATIEAAPGEITRERAQGWRACGINRVSLGVQSFVEAEVRLTGRRHTAQRVAEDVGILRQAGIDRLNVDLIAGLPAQTLASWEESIDWVERLGVGHVSVYMLEVDEDSRLGRELIHGGLRYGAPKTPEEETTVQIYLRAAERLEAAGILRYEISNYARPGEESVHNLKYWRREPYAGFGSDAHSFDGRERSRNAETVVEYLERWRDGLAAKVEATPAHPDEERFFLGLRLTDGVELERPDWEQHREAINRFLQANLVERDGRRLRLTTRGMLLSNEVFQEFLA